MTGLTANETGPLSLQERAGELTLGGLGLFLGGMGFLVVLLRPDPVSSALLIAEIGVAIGLPTLLLVAGYWIAKRDWEFSLRWTVVQWTVAGLVLASFLAQWILLRQGAIGGIIVEPVFFRISTAAIGSVSGFVAGVAHVASLSATIPRTAGDATGGQSAETPSSREGRNGEATALDRVPEPVVTRLIEVLSDQRRRHAVEYLRTAEDSSVEFDDLVDHLVETERGADGATTTSRHRSTVAASLHHHHLPRMEDAGLVTYSTESQVVRYRPGTDGGSSLTEYDLGGR